MTQTNPLHGITLEKMLLELVDYYGWEQLSQRIKIRCFSHEPSIKSSLKFLRRTPWARKKWRIYFCMYSRLVDKNYGNRRQSWRNADINLKILQ